MKLKSVHVRMFRNILDSTDVKIEPKVTCLVGKNEAGKSAFLSALWRLNPARTKPAFSIPEQYPAWLEKRHRNERRNQTAVQPISVRLEWEPSDVSAIEEKFGPGVVKAGTLLTLSKTYDNAFTWISGCDEQQAVKNFVEGQALTSKEYSALSSFDKLAAALDQDIKKAEEQSDALANLTNAKAELKTLLGEDGTFAGLTWVIAHTRLQNFF